MPSSGERPVFSITTLGLVRLNAFDYNADKPDDVVSLETAGVDGQMTLNLSFNNHMQGFLKKFDTFDIEFPDYMTPQSATFGTIDGNILKLGTLNTNRSYVTTVVVKQLKFETPYPTSFMKLLEL